MLSHLQEFCFKSLDLHGPNIDPAQAWMIKIVELFYTMKNLLQIFFQTHTILMSGSGYGGWISWQGLELGTSMLSSQDFDHSWLTTWIPKLGCHIASRETCYILYQVTISSHHTVIKFMTCHIFFLLFLVTFGTVHWEAEAESRPSEVVFRLYVYIEYHWGYLFICRLKFIINKMNYYYYCLLYNRGGRGGMKGV